MLQLTLIFCFIGTILAQTPGLGSCPAVNTLSSFDSNSFSGAWYENRRSIPNFFETETKCVTVSYSDNSNSTIKVVKRRISLLTGQESVLVGNAAVDEEQCRASALGCSKLIYTFPIPIVGNYSLPYWVLDTDYTSFAVVYGCTEILGAHTTYLWILTRESNPHQNVLDAVQNVIQRNKLHHIPTISVDQTNCK